MSGRVSPLGDPVLGRVLRAIADNRTPGLHFLGHFMGLEWQQVDARIARIALDVGEHCIDERGLASLEVVATLADIALANAIRARMSLSEGMRLGTVSMHLTLTGVPLAGRIEAQAVCEGMVVDALTPQGLARCEITAGGMLAALASGTFMQLPPPPGVRLAPLPWQPGGAPAPRALRVADLDANERGLWRRAVAARARSDRPFLPALYGRRPQPFTDAQGRAGARCRLPMGLHAGNRVGHAQGGISFALAAITAIVAAPPDQRLVEASAWFLNPGQGPALRARSTVSRAGRRLSVVDTAILGEAGTRVLEMVSTHVACAPTSEPADSGDT
jgi:acyl-coenzyme A thioesterase PaaI-like protein